MRGHLTFDEALDMGERAGATRRSSFTTSTRTARRSSPPAPREPWPSPARPGLVDRARRAPVPQRLGGDQTRRRGRRAARPDRVEGRPGALTVRVGRRPGRRADRPRPSRTTPPRQTPRPRAASSAAPTSSGTARSPSRPPRGGERRHRSRPGPSRDSSRSATPAWRRRRALAEQPRVRGVVDERVGEPPAVRAVDGDDQRRLGQPLVDVRVDRVAEDLGDDRRPERDADDRRDPEHRPGLLRQRVDPCPEQRPERHRHARPDRAAVAEADRPSGGARRSRLVEQIARTVSVMNSGLPAVRSWSAARVGRAELRAGDGRRELPRLALVEAGQADPFERLRARSDAGDDPGRVPTTMTSGRWRSRGRCASTIPALDGSSQWRSSMKTIRGPDTSSSRSV